jgi:ABC-type glycerol-3-phosphate transport system permease component
VTVSPAPGADLARHVRGPVDSFLLEVPREVLEAEEMDGAGLLNSMFLTRLCAAATLVSLPALIAGWLAQNKLVRGLSMGAVK